MADYAPLLPRLACLLTAPHPAGHRLDRRLDCHRNRLSLRAVAAPALQDGTVFGDALRGGACIAGLLKGRCTCRLRWWRYRRCCRCRSRPSRRPAGVPAVLAPPRAPDAAAARWRVSAPQRPDALPIVATAALGLGHRRAHRQAAGLPIHQLIVGPAQQQQGLAQPFVERQRGLAATTWAQGAGGMPVAEPLLELVGTRSGVHRNETGGELKQDYGGSTRLSQRDDGGEALVSGPVFRGRGSPRRRAPQRCCRSG
jgi:hypothetical protein